MLDNDLIQSMLKKAEAETVINPQQNSQASLSLLIKVIQLEQFSDKDIKIYLSKICNNPMTAPTLEIILALIRLYSSKRLQAIPHINNPIAFAVLKDLEDYLLEEITCILQNNKENLVINHSKVSLIMGYVKKNYGKFYFNVCKVIKKIINK
jgi:1-aminocyclopropane-1-carboxylate deaminase/D-cysteine desulfhydrase-like pyridoxal-dependent ACC family enzyme